MPASDTVGLDATPEPSTTDAPDPNWAEEASPAALVVTVSPSVPNLIADGMSVVDLSLDVKTVDGQPAADGIVVELQTDLGFIDATTPTFDGQSTAVLRAGTWPGRATVRPIGVFAGTPTTVNFTRGEPYSAQLHLHGSFSEGSAGMIDHHRDAENWGLDVLWWTDHDTMYPHSEGHLSGFDFEDGTLSEDVDVWPGASKTAEIIEVHNTLDPSFSGPHEIAAHASDYGWRIEGTGVEPGTSKARYEIDTTSGIQTRMLLSEVSFSFWIRPRQTESSGRLFIEIPLSSIDSTGMPVDVFDRIILYHDQGTDHTKDNDVNIHYVPFSAPFDTWTFIDVDLSQIAREAFDRGADQRAHLFTVKLQTKMGQSGVYDLDDIRWSSAYMWDELREVQRDYANTLGEIVHHVGFEATALVEPHINVLGSSVPFMPWGVHKWLPWDVADHVREHGGLSVYVHMFGVSGTLASDEDIEAAIAEVTEELVSTEVYGLDLLEVGYRQRYGATEHFLEVWDALSRAGILITGIGVSDLHEIKDSDEHPNNFVTWIEAASSAEEDLQPALLRGAAWFGDPTRFLDADTRIVLTAPEHRAVAGQVIVGATEPFEVEATIDAIGPSWEVHFVRTDSVEVFQPEAGVVTVSTLVDPLSDGFIRVEVHDDTGDGILFSNPLYFFDEAMGATVPVERLVTVGG